MRPRDHDVAAGAGGRVVQSYTTGEQGLRDPTILAMVLKLRDGAVSLIERGFIDIATTEQSSYRKTC